MNNGKRKKNEIKKKVLKQMKRGWGRISGIRSQARKMYKMEKRRERGEPQGGHTQGNGLWKGRFWNREPRTQNKIFSFSNPSIT